MRMVSVRTVRIQQLFVVFQNPFHKEYIIQELGTRKIRI